MRQITIIQRWLLRCLTSEFAKSLVAESMMTQFTGIRASSNLNYINYTTVCLKLSDMPYRNWWHYCMSIIFFFWTIKITVHWIVFPQRKLSSVRPTKLYRMFACDSSLSLAFVVSMVPIGSRTLPLMFNSLAPGRFNEIWTNYFSNLLVGGSDISFEIALKWMVHWPYWW